MFDEQIATFKKTGESLARFKYDSHEIAEILDYVVMAETELFRARIKIIRELKQK